MTAAQPFRHPKRETIRGILKQYIQGDIEVCLGEIESALAPKKKGAADGEAKETQANNLYPIAEALAYVCKMDITLNRGRLFREAKALALAGATPETIKANYNGDPKAFWRASDWRGQKGQPPKPENVRETWGQWNTIGQVVGSGNKGFDTVVNMLRQMEANNGDS